MLKYLFGTVLVVFVGYGLIEAWPLLRGPSLSVESPRDNAPFPDGIVSVRGKAARAASLTLDDANLLREEDGSFRATLSLPSGGSILTFVATDRFGRTVTATRTVFVPFGN